MKTDNCLIFDCAVNNQQFLLTNLKPNTKVFTLNPHQNGIEQITAILEHNPSTTVEIIAHGEAGKIKLGNIELTLTNIQKYVRQLQSWSEKIENLLLYSCQVALGETGKNFINILSKITKTKIAASTTLIGDRKKGGTWQLDYLTEKFDLKSALNNQAKLAYPEVLATLTVTTLIDENDGIGNLSLREAIASANSGDTITFATSGVIILTLGQLTVNKSLTIDGDLDDNKTPNITINGNNLSRILNINDSIANLANVTIDGLTLTGGLLTGASNRGAGIFNQENLTLTNSIITGNTAVRGAGIAIDNSGIANISNTTISGNSAGYGGGVYARNGANVTITNSTISGNSANNTNGPGGGVLSNGNTTTTTILNSTIYGNSARTRGGGVYSLSSNVIIRNTTISGNSANAGGGVYKSGLGVVNVTSTIIAQNVTNKDIGGSAFTSGGNNLIGNPGTITNFVNAVNGDIVGTSVNPIDAKLGILQNNGGNVFTQALLAGSVAINSGSNPNNLLTDSRGIGFIREVNQIDIGAFEVQIPLVNTPPIANDDTAITTEDDSVNIAVLNNDTDVEDGIPQLNTFDNVSAKGGLITNVGGVLTYNPNQKFETLQVGETDTDTFTYTVIDSQGLTDSATVTVTINGVNDAPIANDDNFNGIQNTPLNIPVGSLLANDTDIENDTLTVTGVNSAVNGIVSLNNGIVTFTPNANFTGNGSFIYTITDGNGGTDSALVTILINANNPPIANNDTAITTEDTSVNIAVLNNDTDVEDGIPQLNTFDNVSAKGGLITNVGGVLTYNPNQKFETLQVGETDTDTFTYTVIDSQGLTDSATVTVTINGVNDAPIANDDNFNGIQNTPLNIPVGSLLANDTDIENDTLTVTGVNSAVNGIVSLNNGIVTFTPNANFTGNGSFIYSISDGNGGTDSALVSINITNSGTSGTLYAPFSFHETVTGNFTSTVGNFTAVSNTTGSSNFTGTIAINPNTGIQNGVTFNSGFNFGGFLGIGTGTTGVII